MSVLERNVGIELVVETRDSYSSLISTLVPLLIVSVPLLLAFLFLRVKFPRVYSPRSYIETLRDEEKTPKLKERGFISWIPEFWSLSDEEILVTQGLDNYLFLRFMKTITIIGFLGVCLTVPLMIINFMGGKKKNGLGRLTLSNVKEPNTYYYHALIASAFFGYVLYAITKETIYYINLRYAYYLTPKNALRISSRTVLFTSVPSDWRNESWLRAEFAEVDTIWITTDCTKLEKLVKERDNTALKLEDAEVELLTTATSKNRKRVPHRPNEHGENTGRYIRWDERPKTNTFPIVGKRKDAIETARYKLEDLIPKTKQQQQKHLDGHAVTIPAVFIQFETQRAAQAAFQTPRQVQPGNMQPRCIGALPDGIIWGNLGIPRWFRLGRTFIAHSIVALLILFWSIPVGLVGALADLDSLEDDLPFLSFVNKLPVPVLGAITGLLPAILISALLALVPIICRFLANKSGAVTFAEVELRTQGWYFAFQVVQVFLITTFSSGASAVAKQILDDPTQAPTLLAENLPQASNFYLSYFMLQGITVSASEVFQVVPLLMFTVAGRFLDKTPRAKYDRWIALSGISWGDTYPKLTNLAVIALTYSCIAPLTLWFASAGLGLLYLAFRYNIFYALSTTVDTKGDSYARALQHLTVGIYLAELCLIGLFAAKGSRGPTALMVIFFAITTLYQLYLNWVLSPLLYSFTDKLLAEDEQEVRMENGEPELPAQSLGSLVLNNFSTKHSLSSSKLLLHRERGGYFAVYLFHGSKGSYPGLRSMLSSSFPGLPSHTIPVAVKRTAYFNPAITATLPTLWIPKDEYGMSTEQIGELQTVIEVADKCASLDEKGSVVWDENHLRDAPIWKERVDL